ncbi:MAG: hypothetical protein JXA22_07305, partial [Candidatus Thermoplasmatota archaeon]|nr:hypothetical protein [Candidatus Thermoplasmatota archaeon]
MKKILILGLMAILTTTALTGSVMGEDKTILNDNFSFDDGSGLVNMTSKEVEIGESHYNNSAKIFVHNNATYDFMVFDITGKKDPVSGENPSEVLLDLGGNNKI